MTEPVSRPDLNPPQRAAVSTLKGPMLVLAGAGTGKTRVVTYRIANLIRHGTAADRILAVTFTNKAANEMRERVTTLLGRKKGKSKYPHRKKDKGVPEPVVCTFHSLCVRILRRNIDQIGYPLNFSICDRGDQESFARQVLREIRVGDKMLRPKDLLAYISRCKSSSLRPAEAAMQARDDREHLASTAYRRYQEALKAAGSLDFDDLLLCTEDLFQKSKDARQTEAGLFDHILIDEYQDTNRSQYRIVRALASPHRNLCVVGDDDQSIYGWRGAEVEHILRFGKDWEDARVIRLEDNYRSTQAILGWANELIAFNKTRHGKMLKAARAGGETPRVLQFKTETEEAEQVVGEIHRHLAAKRCEPSDVAILFRTNEQPRPFETELRKHKIPYVLIGGMSFFDRREVKDLLSFLQVIVKPDDDPALRRVINVPPRGVTRAAIEKLTDTATQRGISPWQMLADADQVPDVSAAARKGFRRFRQLVEHFREKFSESSLAESLRALIHEIDFLTELRSRYDKPEEATAREATVEQVVSALADYEESKKKPTLQGFLDEITLANRELESDKDKQLSRNRVVLMTMHSAKGLEFPKVYIVGMEEGILPHQRSLDAEAGDVAIEEERRLCYVGVTRAQDNLTLSLALSRRRWGKPRPTDASRFLFEMTGQAERFEPGRAAKAQGNSAASLRRKMAKRPQGRRAKESGRKGIRKSAPGKRRT